MCDHRPQWDKEVVHLFPPSVEAVLDASKRQSVRYDEPDSLLAVLNRSRQGVVAGLSEDDFALILLKEEATHVVGFHKGVLFNRSEYYSNGGIVNIYDAKFAVVTYCARI